MSFSLVPGFSQRYPRDPDEAPVADEAPFAQSEVERTMTAPQGPRTFLIESCCTSLEESVAAQARGAGRIELCADLSVGGLTPPRDLVRDVIAALTIPVNILIRPSAPDFVYGEDALQQMTEDIAYCKSVGAAGIVVGALTPEGAVDLPAMRRLVVAARPLPVTFHRAFDVCVEDPFTALDKIIALGCVRLLSSGQAVTAWDGRCLLALLVRRAGSRLVVMPGCGITPEILPGLAAVTRASEYHGTRLP